MPIEVCYFNETQGSSGLFFSFLAINYMVFLVTKFPAEPLKSCTNAVHCNGSSISILGMLVFGAVC